MYRTFQGDLPTPFDVFDQDQKIFRSLNRARFPKYCKLQLTNKIGIIINNLEIPLNATIRQEYVKCGNPHISTVFATANDKATFYTTLVIDLKYNIREYNECRVGTSCRQRKRVEILLDHIAKNLG